MDDADSLARGLQHVTLAKTSSKSNASHFYDDKGNVMNA